MFIYLFFSMLSLAVFADVHEDYLLTYANKQYQQELKQAASEILWQVDEMPGEPWLLVLDIDETAISNLAWLKKNHFKTSLELFQSYAPKGEGVAIEPIHELYQAFIDRGYPVVFITARHQKFTDITKKLLQKNGYEQWTDLFLKRDAQTAAWQYKSTIRCQLQEKGYHVINIGDQVADMMGGCSTISVKLPNPFYETNYIFAKISE